MAVTVVRKKSKYKPKPVLQNPLGFVLENITPITQHEDYLLNLQLKNSSAMERLLQGKANKKDMNTLIAMSNITEALQLMGFGKEYKEVGVDGREALIGIIYADRTTRCPDGRDYRQGNGRGHQLGKETNHSKASNRLA
jgi:hypothetical protein